MSKNGGMERIREQNDALRCESRGGQTYLTPGVQALPHGTVAHVLLKVANFNDFSPENDPYGEHDCAAVTVGERRIIWKIDHYDISMGSGSPDPSDPEVTKRVLTVMLASEY